ncbi:hypothetical protein MAPG_03881 [Magnaporthiopsis poae ATCC 64411]|uniref:Uncharacterized protein n=1 Tax=Magnaporthiopsis poae (strain ATCC 64411 / 73-15) TaxID=644358 RepID=A0A0C4DV80_MAGP6|nr:hypothetical protein MAPG_03881 [Magnaporthiopsis poae ATCC 64411]
MTRSSAHITLSTIGSPRFFVPQEPSSTSYPPTIYCVMYCKLPVAASMLGSLAWLTTPVAAAHDFLPSTLAPRHHEAEQNTTVLLDPAKLPLCFGSSSNKSLVQQTPFHWPVKGSPVALYTHEHASIWEFRVIPQSDISVAKGWQAIAPLVNQTGAGECCVTRVIGLEQLLDLDAVAAWAQAFVPVPGGSSSLSASGEPTLPVIPSGLESGSCPLSADDDVDPADRAAWSYVVLGSATKNPCVMLLYRMDPEDLEVEMSRMKPSGAAERASNVVLGLWMLVMALALLI